MSPRRSTPASSRVARNRTLVVRIGAAVAVVAILAGTMLAFLPASDTTTSTTGPSTTSPSSSTSAPPSTVSDESFAASVGAIRTLIAESDGDRCILVAAFSALETLPPVNTDDQAENAGKLTAELLTAAAGTTADDEAQQSAAIAAAAQALLAEGEAEGWTAEWLTTAPGAAALSTEEFQQAIGSYQQRSVNECQADLDNPVAGPDAPTTSAPG